MEEVGVKSVKLLWSHGTDNLSPISKYTIQYRETRTEEEWKDAVTCEYFNTCTDILTFTNFVLLKMLVSIRFNSS